ncbi:MAG TPA: TerC family protein, partial [Bacteroidia bacterium]|nr:TerC family protein [Bacteroidia bacterium]
MFANLFTAQGLISLLTLSFLEIILGVDNIIFIAITADKLPANQRGQARTTGLVLAVFIRIALLFTLSFLSSQEAPLFNIAGHGITLRDLIFFGGGVFLLYKTWGEIQEKINGEETEHKTNSKKVSVANIVFQIILIDIVFSFDSILTAIVVSKNLIIMGSAVVIAMAVMVLFSGVVADFINKNPRIKMLALTFLLVIALLLLADSIKTFTGFEIEKSYVYAALGFSLVVELLNMWE